MIYESKVSFTKIDKNGNEKVYKEKYIIEDASSFGDAELLTYQTCDGESNLDVTDIKRSKLKEVANKRENDTNVIWIADVQDTFVDDNGEEKYNVYKIAFYASTFDDANNFITEYLKQGYGDMELVSLKKSNFVDVI